MEEVKKLIFNERSFQKNFKDDFAITPAFNSKSETKLRGHVIFRDGVTGKVLLEKDNEIVLRGRTFALEMLFRAPITGSPYIQNLDRKVCLFQIGTGGAPENDVFQPFVPQYTDMGVSNAVPFLSVDPNKLTSGDPEKASNPSIVTELSPEQALKYYLPVVDPLDPQVTHYLGKVFGGAEWVFDMGNNEVYRKLSLFISSIDARNRFINELSLMIAYYDDVANEYTQVEGFSRLCFDTESLSNLSKSILIDYLIYA